MSQDFIAWKDEDLREELGMISHPAGQIDLSAATGAQDQLSSYPCVFGVTVALSCSPSCERSLFHGSCGALSLGCCLAVG